MDVFLTGATGFLGKNLVENLSSKHNITCLIRDKNIENNENYKFLKSFNVNLIYGDVFNPPLIKGYDVVIHVAALIHGPDNQVLKINYQGTKNILKNCQNIGKFIFISSAGVYGPCENACEDSIINTTNSYEKSKVLAEREVKKSLFPYIILRPGLITGKYEKNISKLSNLAVEGIVPIIGKGQIKIQTIDIKIVVNILEKLMKSDIKNEIFNVAGEIRTIERFIKNINQKARIIHLSNYFCKLLCEIGEISSSIGFPLLLNKSKYRFFNETRTYDTKKINDFMDDTSQ